MISYPLLFSLSPQSLSMCLSSLPQQHFGHLIERRIAVSDIHSIAEFLLLFLVHIVWLIRYFDYSFFFLRAPYYPTGDGLICHPGTYSHHATYIIYVLLELRINPLYIYSSLIFSLIFLHLFVLSRIFSSLRSFQPNSQEMPRSLVSTPSISPPRSSTIVPEKEIAPYSVRNMTLSLSIGNVAARFILELFKWS